MSLICKHCGSDSYVKHGIVKGKQRYRCKFCNRSFREGDGRGRVKYSDEFRIKAVRYYLEGAGARSVARLERVSPMTVINWVKRFADIVKCQLQKAVESVEQKKEDIEILEMDELFTYIKKTAN